MAAAASSSAAGKYSVDAYRDLLRFLAYVPGNRGDPLPKPGPLVRALTDELRGRQGQVLASPLILRVLNGPTLARVLGGHILNLQLEKVMGIPWVTQIEEKLNFNFAKLVNGSARRFGLMEMFLKCVADVA